MSKSSENPFEGVTVVLNEKPCKLVGTTVVSKRGVPHVQFGLQEIDGGAMHALEMRAQDVISVWSKVSGISGSVRAFTDELVAGGRDLADRFRRAYTAFADSSTENA